MKIFADAICSLKVACKNKVSSVLIKKNKKVFRLCFALEELGYIAGFSLVGAQHIKVFLRYYRGAPAMRGLNIFSRSSSRIYLKKRNILGYRVGSFIKNNSFTLFFSSASPYLLTDIELLMLGSGGEPAVVVA